MNSPHEKIQVEGHRKRRRAAGNVQERGGILAVTENRNGIEVFFDGVIMRTETVNLPAGKFFSVYVEESRTRPRCSSIRAR